MYYAVEKNFKKYKYEKLNDNFTTLQIKYIKTEVPSKRGNVAMTVSAKSAVLICKRKPCLIKLKRG